MIVNVINKSNNNLPKYETSGSSGVDVRADFSRVSVDNPIKVWGDTEIIFEGETHSTTLLRLDPGARALIPTGLFTAIPEGYEIQVRPRSGLALKSGLTVLNTPGTVDASYRNEIGVILINHGTESVWIEDGERIAQFVLAKVDTIEWNVVSSLDETDRIGGFGSTGTK
jgi:dUTP pyrophosphatase